MTLADDAREHGQVQELRKTIQRLSKRLDKEKNRTEALAEAVSEAMRDAIAALDLSPLDLEEVEDAPAHLADFEDGEEVAVLLVSDQQRGKETPSYSSEVCDERMGRLAEKVRRITDLHRGAGRPVRGVHRWLLGDVVEGEEIFPGQAHRIDASLYRQIVDGAGMVARLDRALLEDFDWLHSEEVDGNHGRLGRPGQYHPESNADLLLYAMLREIHRNTDADERITYGQIGWEGERNWYRMVDVGRFRAMLFHGDQIRGGYGGIPWYGFSKAILSWAAGAIEGADRGEELERLEANPGAMPYFDAAVCGHWHQAARLPFNQRFLYVNGSTESYNTWAQENLKMQSYPSQTLLFVDPRRGRVTAEYVIDLR